jgi:hypothetical protein
MIAVVILVCLFAVGMATFLNYFKYRSAAERLVQARLTFVGKSIENSIQASLSLGLSFADLNMLPDLMQREQGTDGLIISIKVFDAEGTPLYTTDRLRAGRKVPESWVAAARRAGDADWIIADGNDRAVGIAIKNNFGLTVGYLALRYSPDQLDTAALGVARVLALSALGVFLFVATLACIAMLLILRRLDGEMLAVEVVLQDPGRGRMPEAVARGPFGPALARFLETVRSAELQIAAVRGKLSGGRE